MKLVDITIGASEAAAALGLSSYDTPLQWQMRKLKRVDAIEQNEAMRLGKLLEAPILLSFEQQHDVRVLRGQALCAALRVPMAYFDDGEERGATVSHPFFEWQQATPDGVITRETCSARFAEAHRIEAGEWIVVEAKSTAIATNLPRSVLSQKWGPDGSDVVPQEHAVQVQQQIDVLNAHLEMNGLGFCRRAFLRALVPAVAPLFDFVLVALPGVQSWMREELCKIVEMNLVHEIQMPATTIDDFDMLEGIAKVRFDGEVDGKGKPKTRKATEDEAAIVLEWHRLKEQREALELREKALKIRVIDAIGTGYGIDGAFGRVLHTVGKENSKRHDKAIVDELVALATKDPNDPLAKRIKNLVKDHTRTVYTSRRLMPYLKGATTTTETTTTEEQESTDV